MRDFDFNDNLWCVVKADGSFAGIPCTSYEEAQELAFQHEGSAIFSMMREDFYYEDDDCDDDCGFDPYLGCYTDDC